MLDITAVILYHLLLYKIQSVLFIKVTSMLYMIHFQLSDLINLIIKNNLGVYCLLLKILCSPRRINLEFVPVVLTFHCSAPLSCVSQVCDSCSPPQEFIRLFDVTERTALHRHGTGRVCPYCRAELRDTIVHFGERGTLEQPLNWKGAAEAAQHADLILCLGSSLKVRIRLEFGLSNAEH